MILIPKTPGSGFWMSAIMAKMLLILICTSHDSHDMPAYRHLLVQLQS